MMFRSHRTRLTAVAAGVTGLLLVAMFAIFTTFLKVSELSAAQRELTPALNQIIHDIKTVGGTGDLAEVVASDPHISVAVFDASSNLLESDGTMDLPYTLEDGIHEKLFLIRGVAKDRTVVVGVEWEPRKRLIERFVLACAFLWFPLVGIVSLATWLAAKSTFLPLERLAREAEAMSVEDLSSRLQPEDSGEYSDFVLRLNRFLSRLEDSVRREELFLSDAAHELRTPLTILRGQIETTLQRDRTGSEYRETLEILLDETARLSSLVELLLRSATAATKPSEPIDLGSAAERAHARWVDRYAAKGAKLDLEAPSVQAVLSEPEADVIFDNLLANGLRVSGPEAGCKIQVFATEDQAVVKVIDEGPGLTEEEASKVFDRYVSSSTDGSGFGIGLAVVKRILAARKGHISFQPNQPKGSIFTMAIPLRDLNAQGRT